MSLFCVYVQLRNEFMINVVRSLMSELCSALVNQVGRGIQSYKKKGHRILPQMSHITKKLYSAKNTKVKMIRLYFI